MTEHIEAPEMPAEDPRVYWETHCHDCGHERHDFAFTQRTDVRCGVIVGGTHSPSPDPIYCDCLRWEDVSALLEHPPCPTGCGCRLWTDDADAADCGCDGPCCWMDWDQFMDDVLARPEWYVEMRDGRGYSEDNPHATRPRREAQR